MPFTFDSISLPGLVIVKTKPFIDDRGFFIETYKESDFYANGIPHAFVQDNHSKSAKGVLRGLHYQLPPKAQGKLIRVVRGIIWDVALDIRRKHPNFKKWYGVELSDENNLMLYIPPGFAHGFITLSDEAHITYKCTEEYDKTLERGIRWNDPDICIDWPLKKPLISEKDSNLPLIKDAVFS